MTSKPQGTFDHPTKFAAVPNTDAGIELAATAYRAGDLVSVPGPAGRQTGTLIASSADGSTHRVDIENKYGAFHTVTVATDELGPEVTFEPGDHVDVLDTDTNDVLDGVVVNRTFGEFYTVRVSDPTGDYTESIHVNSFLPKTLVRLASESPDEHFPGTHPAFPGKTWGIVWPSHWGTFDVNHGYFTGYQQGLNGSYFFGKDSAGNPVPIPEDTVAWHAQDFDPEDAETVWAHRDDITAALLERGLGGQRRARVTISVEKDGLHVSPFDYHDEFEPVVVPFNGWA